MKQKIQHFRGGIIMMLNLTGLVGFVAVILVIKIGDRLFATEA